MAPAIPYPPKYLSSRYINTNMVASPFDRAIDPSAIWPRLQSSESSVAHVPALSHLHISFSSDSTCKTCKTVVSPDGRSEWEGELKIRSQHWTSMYQVRPSREPPTLLKPNANAKGRPSTQTSASATSRQPKQLVDFDSLSTPPWSREHSPRSKERQHLGRQPTAQIHVVPATPEPSPIRSSQSRDSMQSELYEAGESWIPPAEHLAGGIRCQGRASRR